MSLTRRDKNREIRHLLNGESAKKSIGIIFKGMEIYGLTKGQFSIINIIEEILNQTGAADVVISTWTAANAEIKKAENFISNEKIRSIRWVVDRSFKTRQPKYYNLLLEKFGGVIAETNSHAKFVVIKNENWDIVIRTSMNLNENKRLENFEISDDKNLSDYLLSIVDEIFSTEFSYKNFKELGVSKEQKDDSDPFLDDFSLSLDDFSL